MLFRSSPVASFHLLNISGGSASPADAQMRTCLKGLPSIRFIIELKSVGTPKNTVGLNRSAVARTFSGEGLSDSRITDAPCLKGKEREFPKPYAKKSLLAENTISSSVSFKTSFA